MNDDKILLKKATISGSISIPTSKSLAHRAILSALLAEGTSKITNVSMSEDIHATLNAAVALGAKVTVDGSTVLVTGIKERVAQSTEINCNESGSTIRFLIPILSLFEETFSIQGKESLIQRPLTVYETIFQGQTFERGTTTITFKGSLTPGKFEIPGNISSQFVTGLLLVLPLLNGNSEIVFTSPLQSRDYVKLTLDVLADFGVNIQETNDGYTVIGNQTYISTNYAVEGDYSQAAFWFVNGAINGPTTLTNMNLASHQGDKLVLDYLKQMNAKISFEKGITVTPSVLNPIIIDLANIPDCGPVLALLATQIPGTTKFINIERLRIKESDRVESTVQTLKKLGATIEVIDDSIQVIGPSQLVGNVTLDSYNDHRIAMMIAIAAGFTDGDITLNRATAVNKSYPTFFEEYLQMGGSFRKLD